MERKKIDAKIVSVAFCFFVLMSCHPGRTVFIRNQTDRPVKIVLTPTVPNPFFQEASVIHLKAESGVRDSILNYGPGARWTSSEKEQLEELLNKSTIVFSDNGDTLLQKNIAVQNIQFQVNELYVRIKR